MQPLAVPSLNQLLPAVSVTVAVLLRVFQASSAKRRSPESVVIFTVIEVDAAVSVADAARTKLGVFGPPLCM